MHTFALIISWHLDTPHLLGGQIILAKGKRSLEQILNWMFFPKKLREIHVLCAQTSLQSFTSPPEQQE